MGTKPDKMIAVGTYELYASTNGQDRTIEFRVTITVTYRVGPTFISNLALERVDNRLHT